LDPPALTSGLGRLGQRERHRGGDQGRGEHDQEAELPRRGRPLREHTGERRPETASSRLRQPRQQRRVLRVAARVVLD
jgi:hypothetical protein